MAIKYQKYKVDSGTILFDFEIYSSPDDHRSLADRLKEIGHMGNPTEVIQRMPERPMSTRHQE